MRKFWPLKQLGWAILAAVWATPFCYAQVQWRTDYNAARKEAQERGCPMLLDFGTQNCFYCKKLDATTFRDPAVVRSLNEQFVALKIDAEREAALAQALRISKYPTLIIAGPDGKILGMIEGYMEAPRLNEHLARAAMTVATPDWMARDLQEANRAIGSRDYGRAVTLLKAIDEDGKNRPVQVKARQILEQLEQQATGRLAYAKQMEDRGQTTQAIDTLTELLKNYAGTQAAIEASNRLVALSSKPEMRQQHRDQRAKELLALAKNEFKSGNFLICLEHCDTLSAQFGDLSEGKEAMQIASEVKSNPEWIARACEQMSDRLAGLYLTQAESWAKKGESAKATACLEQVVRQCPGTIHAENALAKLSQYRGQTTQSVDYQKR